MNQRITDIAVGLGFVLVGVLIYLESTQFDPRTARLPMVIAGTFVVLGRPLFVAKAIPRTGRQAEDE